MDSVRSGLLSSRMAPLLALGCSRMTECQSHGELRYDEEGSERELLAIVEFYMRAAVGGRLARTVLQGIDKNEARSLSLH